MSKTSKAGPLFDGITPAEYLQGLPQDLDDDDVGLWHIVKIGREGFALAGADLNNFVHRAITILLEHGASPTSLGFDDMGSPSDTSLRSLGSEEVATTMLERWHRAGHDPGLDGPWFFIPEGRT